MTLAHDYRRQYGDCAQCGTRCDPCNAYTLQIDHHVWHTRSLRASFTLCAGCYQGAFPWPLPSRPLDSRYTCDSVTA